jgi:predicted DNA-binding transcriptional regulator AlpA
MLLDTAQAAAYLNVAVATLAKWRWLKKGPQPIAYGRRKIVYRRAELDRWIAEQEAASTRVHAEKRAA